MSNKEELHKILQDAEDRLVELLGKEKPKKKKVRHTTTEKGW